jgi:molecular chaperone HtpG
MPEMYNLVVNTNHAYISDILGEKDEGKRKEMIKQGTDLALLAQNLLQGEALTSFVKRSFEKLHNS